MKRELGIRWVGRTDGLRCKIEGRAGRRGGQGAEDLEPLIVEVSCVVGSLIRKAAKDLKIMKHWADPFALPAVKRELGIRWVGRADGLRCKIEGRARRRGGQGAGDLEPVVVEACCVDGSLILEKRLRIQKS